MHFKKLIPVASSVYRPLVVRRYVMMTMGRFWPVIQKLPDGRLGVVTRDGDFHIGERGRLVFLTSSDGGESWSHATVISEDGRDNRNPALGVAADGTLVASFIKADRYTDGNWDPMKDPGGHTPMYISRSVDGGAIWSEAELVDGQGHEQWIGVGPTGPDDPHRYYSPFGKMVTLPDGTLLMAYYIDRRRSSASFLLRSRDGGRTWVDPVTIFDSLDETAICHLGDGRVLAMLRGGNEGEPGLWHSVSDDLGYNWSQPRQVTADLEHPGDVIRLQDGLLPLTYGRRVPPFGVQGMLSSDDGKTWDTERKLLLVADAGDWDCGYPSSVQMDDGTIVTVYYASDIVDDPRMGIYGGSLRYRPEEI